MSLVTLGLLAALGAQPPTAATQADAAPPTLADALPRFEALPILRQAMVVRRAEQRLLEDSLPALARIAMFHGGDEAAPERSPLPFFDPEEWTGGVAAARHVIPASDPRHVAVRASAPHIEVLADLHRRLAYDWGRGILVREPKALSFAQRFANLLHGYPPGSDEAFARLQAALDWDASQEPLRAYFEHAYCDLDGGVYDGVTIYEAWYAGTTVNMPDVDVIPFAVKILRDKSYHSPIPADARRERLYAQIRDKALAYRQYKTTIEAAAAAFVRAEPEMDPMYARMVPRFHYLWKVNGDDVARMQGVLTSMRTRDRLIAEVDGTVVSDPDAMEARDRRKSELAAMAARVRDVALTALGEEPHCP